MLSFLITTALFVGSLAGSARRLLGQKEGVDRALALSSRLGALFDLSKSDASEAKLVEGELVPSS